jgi:hypothetical protein
VLERILLGSVAESLVRHAKVPVLVVPAPDAATNRSPPAPDAAARRRPGSRLRSTSPTAPTSPRRRPPTTRATSSRPNAPTIRRGCSRPRRPARAATPSTPSCASATRAIASRRGTAARDRPSARRRAPPR